MNNRLINIGLFAVLIALSGYFYRDTISKFPVGIHAWSQADRYALALKFADNGLNLFKPQTYDLDAKDGYTAVDLPVHDYVVAVIMKITGSRSPGIFRVYVLLFCFLGYGALYRLVWRRTGSWLKALVLVFFVFSAPVIAYYQAGFIPSATSLAAALLGYEAWFRSKEKGDGRSFMFAIGWFTLAALSRSPFHIFLFAILLHELLLWWRQGKTAAFIWKTFGVAYLIIGLAMVWKAWMQQTYGSIFLNHLMPAGNWADFRALSDEIWHKWKFQLATRPHYIVLLLLLISWLIQIIRQGNNRAALLDKPMLLQAAITGCGALIYYSLMTRQFVDHEYYFMDSFYLPLILLIAALLKPFPGKGVQGLALLGLLLLTLLTGAVRDTQKVLAQKYDPLGDRGEVTRQNFIGSAALLDSLGIPKDAKMLVIDAWSYNVPFILMQRFGYPLLSTRRSKVEAALQLPIDYVVVQDIYFPSDVVSEFPDIVNHLERVGGNGNISIFRYHTDARAGDLAQALNMLHPTLDSRLDFEGAQVDSCWNFSQPDSLLAYNSRHAIAVKSEQDFGPGYFTTGPYKRLLVEAMAYSETADTPVTMVCSIEKGDQKFYYERVTIKPSAPSKWQYFSNLFKIPEGIPKDATIKCYFWNEKHGSYRLDDIRIKGD